MSDAETPTPSADMQERIKAANAAEKARFAALTPTERSLERIAYALEEIAYDLKARL